MKWNPRKEKLCARCGASFLPISSNNRYCRTCAPLANLERRRRQSGRYYSEHRETLKMKNREYRAKRPKFGFKPKECSVCHQMFKPESGNQRYCRTCKPAVQKEWYRANATLYRIRHPETAKEVQRRSKEKHRERYTAMQPTWSARYSDEVRRKVFGHYSNGTLKCACCGESEIDFLTIDHVNNDGARERRRLFGTRNYGGTRFYTWLARNGFPPGLAVLCMNCNLSKGKHGVCAHQTSWLALRGDSCRS